MLFIRAYLGFLGILGRFLHWLFMDLPMIRLRNACAREEDKEIEDLWNKYFIINWDDTPEVNKRASMYAISKMSKIRVWFEINDKQLDEKDDYDLCLFYTSIGYIKEIYTRINL